MSDDRDASGKKKSKSRFGWRRKSGVVNSNSKWAMMLNFAEQQQKTDITDAYMEWIESHKKLDKLVLHMIEEGTMSEVMFNSPTYNIAKDEEAGEDVQLFYQLAKNQEKMFAEYMMCLSKYNTTRCEKRLEVLLEAMKEKYKKEVRWRNLNSLTNCIHIFISRERTFKHYLQVEVSTYSNKHKTNKNTNKKQSFVIQPLRYTHTTTHIHTHPHPHPHREKRNKNSLVESKNSFRGL